MATCEKRVSGQVMSYPCILDAGHEANGPEDDREPCMAQEVAASIRRHEFWEVRETARTHTEPVTAEAIAEQVEQDMAVADVAEPEHNLRSIDCMMRPADSASAILGVTCPTCTREPERPAVLVANDQALRAGEMHNPYDVECAKWIEGEPYLRAERCYVCRPDALVQEAAQIEQEQADARLKTADGESLTPNDVHSAMLTIELGDGSKFLNHTFAGDWEDCAHPFCAQPRSLHYIPEDEDAKVEALAEMGFEEPEANLNRPTEFDLSEINHEEMIPADLVMPTKQREGDQRLPNKGHMVVQDWIIATMEESKRVGTERYGQPLMTFDGRLNIRDLAEELRDAFVYVSKLQMMAEADKSTLVQMVTQALEALQQGANPSDLTTAAVAEVAVEQILDWVLVQRIGPEQVMPIRVRDDEEMMGT